MKTVFVVKYYDRSVFSDIGNESVKGIFTNKHAAEEFTKTKGYTETEYRDHSLVNYTEDLVDISAEYELNDEDGWEEVMTIEEWILHD